MLEGTRETHKHSWRRSLSVLSHILQYSQLLSAANFGIESLFEMSKDIYYMKTYYVISKNWA